MNIQKLLFTAAMACSVILAQGPPAGAPKGGGAPKGPPRPAFWVSSTAWADGDFVPMKYSGRGDNKSPAFEFHWNLGTNPTTAPDTLQSYAVIFHDAENSTNRTAVDTLHWSAYNIPGTAKGLPEGLPAGDQPDGMKNGPGIRGGPTGAFFGPGAGPGPVHHYIFEFYALDAKLDLGEKPTRDELLKAMDTHVIGKAVYYGRFRNRRPRANPNPKAPGAMLLALFRSPAVLALGRMIKQVVRCSVCMKVHDITELVDRKQAANGSCTFTCPWKKTLGSYRLENVGTLKMAAVEAVPAL